MQDRGRAVLSPKAMEIDFRRIFDASGRWTLIEQDKYQFFREHIGVFDSSPNINLLVGLYAQLFGMGAGMSGFEERLVWTLRFGLLGLYSELEPVHRGALILEDRKLPWKMLEAHQFICNDAVASRRLVGMS